MIADFTPLSSLIGGMMIGAAAGLLMLGTGRIAGATGILSGAIFSNSKDERIWRIVMLAGMVLAFPLIGLIANIHPNVVPPFGILQIVFGGLVVGIGVSLASGCTSGHGICGLARLSKRSLVAVVSFMASAFITVFIIRHILGA